MPHEQLRLATLLDGPPRIERQVARPLDVPLSTAEASELEPNFELLASHGGWRTTWSHIVAGHFSDEPFDGLLCYEQATGHGEFYKTDGQGGITSLAIIHGWHRGWTHMLAGKFSDSPYTSLLCYDAATGLITFYDVDGQGGLIKRSEHRESTHSWTHITTVRLPSSAYSGVVLYDQSVGRGEIRECTGGGHLQLRQASDAWRTSWTHVVGSEGSASALLFYEGGTGHCEVYQLTYDASSDHPETNDPATLGPMVQSDVLPVATDIVPGSFGWDATFLFYNRTGGTLDFVFLVYDHIEVVESYTRVRTSWDIIVPGGFWVADDADVNFPQGGFSDLLFYDRGRGARELYLHEPPRPTPSQDLAGYPSSGSARAGQSLDFFVSSRVGPYTIRVYRQAIDEIFMTEVLGLPLAPEPLPISRTAWRDGAGWPAAGTLQIPFDWPSGLYLARVAAAGATPVDIPFIVRSVEAGSQSKILVAMNDTTYNAYNYWGGRSNYGFGSLGTFLFSAPGSGDGDLPWGYRLSLHRPQAGILPEYVDKWTHWEVPLARWLARQDVQVEWCTLLDIQAEPALLDRYAMFVNVGHAEYVSAEMRERIVRFVTAGGNAAFFGGNNVWWRIRIEGQNDVAVCYKIAEFDPNQSALTVNWSDALASETQGVAWSGKAFSENPRERTDANGLLKYTVAKSDHWVFAGTGLHNGDHFGTYGGGQLTNVGSETDARKDGAPDGFMTLAQVDFRDPESGSIAEVATMGLFTRGGRVFTASTNDWTLGLDQDGGWGPIDQITRNVFDAFSPSWVHKDLCVLTGAPAATSDPAAYEFTLEATKHVAYHDAAGHIRELWWDAEHGWGTGDLSSVTGAPHALGSPAGYQFRSEPTQHVVYRGTDQHIYEFWWEPSRGWGNGDLTGTVGTALAAGDPWGYAFEAAGTQHVIYRGVDGHIHELWWDAANGWGAGDLTDVTGVTAPAGDPSGYSLEATSTQHVVYRGTDNHIHELWWGAANGWRGGDLCAETGAPAAAGDPFGYVFDAQGTQHVVYRAATGHIIELWWDAATGWSAGDLTAVSGAPPAAGDPVGFAFAPRSTQHVFYRGAEGHVHELRWG